jgi:hypothetical protein
MDGLTTSSPRQVERADTLAVTEENADGGNFESLPHI